MSLSITQTPATVNLAQSPIIFTVAESNGALLTSSSFQYVGELYYWQGGPFDSGSAGRYTITKYPNNSKVGIFDLNRIINSALTDLALVNTSNVYYLACDFYTEYLSGSTYVTGSHTKSDVYKALDGYGIFPEPVGQQIYNKSPYWPLMTDGPQSQSVLINDIGTMGVYVGTTGGTQPDRVKFTSNLTSIDFLVGSTTSTSGQIVQVPQAPGQSGFPLSTTGLIWYKLQAYNGSTPLGSPIRFNVDCIQKYPNVRIQWKNRYGQFDWYSFYMVNRQSFNTTRKTYQPQLGSWESSTFGYNTYDSANLNYIVDSKQTLQVNSYWLDDSYNDLIKQLMVSDEIYWINNGVATPITIATQNITFKTGVVDKLIQYQFDFNFGQAYKLIM
jgi:hypothetical protein